MVALPRSLPRPKLPSVKRKVSSASQKKPDKCVKGSSFSCGATCLPKLTKEGKRTICHMALAGNPKILVSWLGKQHQTGQMAGILNKDAVKEGRGIAYTDPKTGKLEVEDMSSYLTGTKKIVMENGKAIAESKGFNVKPFMEKGKLTPEGQKVNAQIKSLEEKASKAKAIAARATHPEQIKRANLLMSRFRGQAKKLKDWITGQGKVEPVKTQEVEPAKKVEKLATAIAKNANQLQKAVTQVEQPKPKSPPPRLEPTEEMVSLIREGYKITGQDGDNLTFTKGNKQVVVNGSKKTQVPDPIAEMTSLGRDGYKITGQDGSNITFKKGDKEVVVNVSALQQPTAKPKKTEKEPAIAAKPSVVAPKPKPAEATSEPKPTTPKPKLSGDSQKAQPKPDSKHSMSDVVSAFNSKKIDSLDGLTITPLTMTKESVQGQVGLDAKRIMQFEPTSMGNATYLQFEMGGQSWMVPNNKSPHFQKIVANLKTENTGIFDVDGDSIRLSKPALLKRAANGNLEIAERGKMGDTVEKITPQPKSSATSSKPVEASQVQETPFKDEEIPNVADAIRSGFKLAGEGAYGKVYVKGNQAVKYANIKENEYAIAKQADELGIGPKVYARNSTQAVGERAMAMEFLAGDPLERTAPLNGKSLNGEHFDLTMGLMAKMHTAGIAHGDLHTGNMILTDGELKAIDFGNSRVNDHKAIIEEMLKPSFIRDRPSSDTEITTEGSKMRSRYDSARQGFMDQYGKSGENWPTGKDAENAIADFYERVLNGSKSQTKPTSDHLAQSKSVTPKEATKEGYSQKELDSLNTEHQKSLYSIAMKGNGERDPATAKVDDGVLVKVSRQNENYQRPKIEKLKQQGLSDMEAMGVAAWTDHNYKSINRVIYGDSNYIDPQRELYGKSAGFWAAKGLAKLPSYSKSEILKMVNERGLSMIKDGHLARYVNIAEDQMDSFLSPYRDAIGKSEFKEPTFFATTALTDSGFEGQNTQFLIKPRSDGSGQGKLVDPFKNDTFEGEVLFPPYSRFRVTKIETPFDLARKELQGKLPDKYRKMSKDTLVSHLGELRGVLADLLLLGHGKKDAQERLERRGIHVGSKGQSEEMSLTIKGLLQPNGRTVIHMEEL